MNKNYFTGIIGALIGGMIATIPWILVYVYGGYILSLLAIIIAIGTLKGYKLLKGKIDNKLPIIITIVSIICVTIATFVIIPITLLLKEGFSIADFSWVYNNSEFTKSMISDYVVSIVFTILGISGVITNIKKQLKEGKVDIKVSFKNEETKASLEKIKEVCTRLDATKKETAISEEMLINELNDPLSKDIINIAISNGVLRKSKTGYYYSESKKANVMALTITFIIIAVAIVFGIIINAEPETDTNKDETISSSIFTFTLDKDWQENEEYREQTGRYYVRKDDIEGNRGHIYISYFDIKDTEMSEEEYNEYLIDYLKESDTVTFIKNDTLTIEGKKTYRFLTSFETDYGTSYETIYLVFNQDNCLMLDNVHYTEKINNDQMEANKKIIKTLEWK